MSIIIYIIYRPKRINYRRLCMSILGKDLLYSRMNPFELTAMFSDGKVIIGEETFPIGEMLVRLLNYDAAEVFSAVDEFINVCGSDNMFLAKEKLITANRIIFSMPPYSYVRHLAEKAWFGEQEFADGFISYFPVFANEREYIDPGMLNDCVRMYSRLKEDIVIFKNRYANLLNEIYRSLGEGSETYPTAIEAACMQPFLTGASLGERMEHDPARSDVSYSLRDGILYEDITFSGLLDFLYVDFFKGIMAKHLPKRCRLCSRWFLQEEGFSFEYCCNPSPNNPDATCREIGSKENFSIKVRTNPVWNIYERAYKKYYARILKKKWDRVQFAEWQSEALSLRDDALEGKISVDEFQERINRY